MKKSVRVLLKTAGWLDLIAAVFAILISISFAVRLLLYITAPWKAVIPIIRTLIAFAVGVFLLVCAIGLLVSAYGHFRKTGRVFSILAIIADLAAISVSVGFIVLSYRDSGLITPKITIVLVGASIALSSLVLSVVNAFKCAREPQFTECADPE